MIVFRDYPNWSPETLDDVKQHLREIENVRKDDITQVSNLVNIFVSGRKVGKVPASSLDVTDGDKVDDINWDASYLYILVDNAGVGEWRRASLGVW